MFFVPVGIGLWLLWQFILSIKVETDKYFLSQWGYLDFFTEMVIEFHDAFVQIAEFEQKGLIFNNKNVQNLLRKHKIVDFGNYCHFKYFIIEMSQNVFKEVRCQ